MNNKTKAIERFLIFSGTELLQDQLFITLFQKSLSHPSVTLRIRMNVTFGFIISRTSIQNTK